MSVRRHTIASILPFGRLSSGAITLASSNNSLKLGPISMLKNAMEWLLSTKPHIVVALKFALSCSNFQRSRKMPEANPDSQP